MYKCIKRLKTTQCKERILFSLTYLGKSIIFNKNEE